MCHPAALMIGSLVLTAAGGYQQAQAAKQDGNYQAAVAKQNETISKIKGRNELAIGAQEEDRKRAQIRQMIGKQRAVLGANNVDSSSGSALDLITETATLGEEDALTIRANAARRAWGFDVEANNYNSEAQFARATGRNQARGTLLSTGASIMGTAANYDWKG